MKHPYTVTRTGGTTKAEAKVGGVRVQAERGFRWSNLAIFRADEFEPAFTVEREGLGGFQGLVASVVAGTLYPEALLAIVLHMLPPNAQVSPAIEQALRSKAQPSKRKGAA